jgi:N-acetylmuramoyl-L-alanine amidase
MKVTGLIYSSGHTDKLKGDLGAISPNKKEVEGFLTVEAKNILTKYTKLAAEKEGIKNLNLLVDRDDTALAETMQFLQGRTKPTDILIDLHFNAANGKARGTEVLIPEVYTKEELEIADRISDIIGNVLKTPERGIIGRADGVKTEASSARKRLGWMRMTGINILIEVEFLDNPDAMEVYHRNKETVWKLVAEYLVGLYKQSLV